MKENLQTDFLTRQYMVSKDFEIYYYHNRTVPPPVKLHRHDYYEFYFFLEGNVQIQIQEQKYPLRPGDLIVIPPGYYHQSVIENMLLPYNRFVLWISREYFAQLASESADYLFLVEYVQQTNNHIFHNDRVTFNSIESRIFRLIEEQRSAQFGNVTQCRLCVRDLMLFLNRLAFEQLHPESQSTPETLYESVADYIENHLEDNLSLEKLAQEFYVSKFHISHVFKDYYGISIHRYITKKRLQACREAIESGGRISELCRRFGFGDYSSFYRSFKKEFGISPKDCQDMIFLNADNTHP